ncbi:MAG: DUF6683 family protein [Sphingomonadaceae bacterium]
MKVFHKLRFAAPVTFLLAISLPAPVMSQYTISTGTAMDLSFGAGQYLLGQIVLKDAARMSQKKSGSSSPKSSTNTTSKVAPSPKPESVKLTDTRFSRRGGHNVALNGIVATYPAGQQAEARQLFDQLLNTYPSVMRQLGQSENDLAVGMAAYIAANYSGYNNVPFPDEKFAPLVEQMRESMQADPQIAALTPEKKQKLNDTMAAIAMQAAVMQNRLQQNPDPAMESQLRQFSEKNLRDGLGINARDIKITEHGMIL